MDVILVAISLESPTAAVYAKVSSGSTSENILVSGMYKSGSSSVALTSGSGLSNVGQ